MNARFIITFIQAGLQDLVALESDESRSVNMTRFDGDPSWFREGQKCRNGSQKERIRFSLKPTTASNVQILDSVWLVSLMDP